MNDEENPKRSLNISSHSSFKFERSDSSKPSQHDIVDEWYFLFILFLNIISSVYLTFRLLYFQYNLQTIQIVINILFIISIMKLICYSITVFIKFW